MMQEAGNKKKPIKKYIILKIKTNYNYNNNTTECNEYLCKRKIYNKKQKLCEKHYRQSRSLLISRIIPNCIYSDNCNRKIFRKLLCDLHYKKYQSKDLYTIGIVNNYLKKLNRKT
jgi:hypothetical protein